METTVRKTIIKKSTGEWLRYMSGEWCTSDTPYIYPMTLTEKGLKKYAKEYDNVPNLDMSDVKIVEVEIKILKEI